MDIHVNLSRTQPDNWEEALVTGNGRQGALCYGGPAGIRIGLSHERLFLPVYAPLPAPDTARILPELRALLAERRYQAAADRVVELAAAGDPGYAQQRWIDPLVGAATLTLTIASQGPARDHWRGTDFPTGVVTQCWYDDAGEVRVEVFASRPADAVVVRTSRPASLVLAPIAGTPPRPVEHELSAHRLRARFPGADWPEADNSSSAGGHNSASALPGGTPDRTKAGLTPRSDLELSAVTGYTVTVRTAGEGLFLVRTEVDGHPAAGPPLAELPADFDTLLAEHTGVHGELFARCRLDLDGPDAPATTEELLAEGMSPALARRLFDAGRYAIISSTGDLPPTLQGVWSATYDPAWCSGYTVDGNVRAAVAGLLPTGTPELLLPLFDLLESVRDDLRDNARRLYGADGILIPCHLSTHGRHNHFGPIWCQTFWTAGAAWLSRFYYDYWRYTGDQAFLVERALPFMREAARFHLDFAVPDGPGRYLFSPSLSPENAPASTGSQACVNATMDVAAVKDLLRSLLDATAELGLTDPDEPRWRQLLHGLPAYRIAPTGELAEWIPDHLTDQHAHRHASHLYPMWHEPDPTMVADPALREAAARAIRARLTWWAGAESDEMAYGLVQLGLAAAALGLADEAYTALTHLAERYWRPSLVSTHNRNAIFNVDICGGLPALVAAMLLHCGYGRLDLLPALPSAWPQGRVAGLRARDALVVDDLGWTSDTVEATLTSGYDQHLTVGPPAGMTLVACSAECWNSRPDLTARIELPAGRPVTLRAVRRH